jgi:DNA-binding CsgD family transcriptional regulator
MGGAATRASPAQIAEIERRLAVLDLDDGPALPWLVHSLSEVLGSPTAIAYGCSDDGERVHCDFVHASWPVAERMLPLLDGVLAKHGATGPGYDPRRPEPRQRNRALFLEETIGGTRAAGKEVLANAPTREALTIAGIWGQDQLRALVCDGPSLLAWLGAFSPDDFDEAQRRTFDALLPAIQRRLSVERRLAIAEWALPALDAALEDAGTPSAIVRADGRLVHANTAARAARERDRRDFAAKLDDSLHGRSDAFRLVPLACRGLPEHYLAIATPSREEAVSARCARAAATWSLTPRQRDVLEQMVLGLPNKTIAAVLAMSERTVEVHVGSILTKAQQESRAAVIARVLGG